jgi:hypothetical protein
MNTNHKEPIQKKDIVPHGYKIKISKESKATIILKIINN